MIKIKAQTAQSQSDLSFSFPAADCPEMVFLRNSNDSFQKLFRQPPIDQFEIYYVFTCKVLVVSSYYFVTLRACYEWICH